jgi:guanylate kinase
MPGKIIIVSAPSGSGKTTLLTSVLPYFPNLGFSVSATSRTPRANEVHGKDYYFVSNEEFDTRISNNQFIEWEEVYKGTRYGTLRSELNRLWQQGKDVIFDLDVVGGMNIKKQYPLISLSVFIRPPSIQVLRERLIVRATDDPGSIDRRLARAAYELDFASKFDKVVVNDDLDKASHELKNTIAEFLNENA